MSRGALEGEGGDIVCAGSHLWRGEGAEPDSRLLAGLADFGNPFAPAALADAMVEGVGAGRRRVDVYGRRRGNGGRGGRRRGRREEG